ncbi:hypothetical protein H312_01617, partial [Anncaliia algerae PRA339]
IIRQYIRPDILIITNCDRIYDTLELEGYQHLRVNHTENFVNPIQEPPQIELNLSGKR